MNTAQKEGLGPPWYRHPQIHAVAGRWPQLAPRTVAAVLSALVTLHRPQEPCGHRVRSVPAAEAMGHPSRRHITEAEWEERHHACWQQVDCLLRNILIEYFKSTIWGTSFHSTPKLVWSFQFHFKKSYTGDPNTSWTWSPTAIAQRCPAATRLEVQGLHSASCPRIPGVRVLWWGRHETLNSLLLAAAKYHCFVTKKRKFFYKKTLYTPLEK